MNKNSEKKEKIGFSTKTIHEGEKPNLSGTVSPDLTCAIHPAVTYARTILDEELGGHEYGRLTNPTRSVFLEKMKALEEGRYAHVFSSGMAAETMILLSFLKQGDRILCSKDLYGGTRRLFDRVFDRFGLAADYIDLNSPEEREKACRPETKLVWTESPGNPMLSLVNIPEVAAWAKTKGLLTLADNTIATPYFQQPLLLGADIVLHSTTKYLNGHNDAVGGSIVLNREDLNEQLEFVHFSVGGCQSPFDNYLTLRGLKTLSLRMERHQKNALRVSAFLEDHPAVERVLYPGLPSHPQHELARELMSGFSSMVCFYLKDPSQEKLQKTTDRLRHIAVAESFGLTETIISVPYYMSHQPLSEEEKHSLGITKSFVRLSVGLEDAEDLISDLNRALDI